MENALAYWLKLGPINEKNLAGMFLSILTNLHMDERTATPTARSFE